MTIPLQRLAELLYNRPLLVTPKVANTVSGVLLSHIEARLAGESTVQAMRDDEDEREPRASSFVGEVLKSESGDGSRTPYRVTKDGTAVITIVGELVNRGAWIGADSGLVSYEGIKQQLDVAVRDSRVKSILLDIESPGGEAIGAFDMAAAVRKAAAAKPVTAFANGMAASAAYAIASGASRRVIAPDGMGGSIGVVLMHVDYSRMLQNRGITPTLIFAGDHKVDANPFEALPPEVRQDLQAEVENFYNLFVKTVADGTGLSEDAIRGTEARMYIGQAAVDAGLFEAVGNLDSVLAEHSARNATNQRPRVAATTQTKEKSMFTKEFKQSLGLAETATDAEVQEKVASIQASAARTEAAEKESKRVAANAQVEAWERDGKISGNATAKVRTLYFASVTGEKVTPEMVADMVAALPKLDTSRVAVDAKPSRESENAGAGATAVSIEDFAKMGDAKTAQKIAAVVAERQKANPKFTRDDLRRELEAKK